jgi:hydrogenase maturation protease
VTRAVVFAYGNTLRSDDGAGWLVGELLAEHPPIETSVQITHQLTPELAADVDGPRIVVFVDARVTDESDSSADVQVDAIRATSAPRDAHRLSPGELLWLADTLFGARPKAYIVSVPAFSFGLGETLSRRTAALLPEAERAVRGLVDLPRSTTQAK